MKDGGFERRLKHSGAIVSYRFGVSSDERKERDEVKIKNEEGKAEGSMMPTSAYQVSQLTLIILATAIYKPLP